MAFLWNKLIQLFSRSTLEGGSEAKDGRRPSIEPATSSSTTSNDTPDSPTTEDSPTHTVTTNTNSSNNTTNTNTTTNKPRTKPKSVGRNSGISDKELQQLKEKYRPDSSSSEGEATTPRRPKKKKNKVPSSRSSHTTTPYRYQYHHTHPTHHTHHSHRHYPNTRRRKSGSLRKTVLMQEEAKHVMMLDDVRAPDTDGNTPLHRVSLLGNYEAVSLLCKRAPDIINRLNKNGMSALHFASNANCVNVLVWWGAGIDIRSSSGKTPLYCAVERGTNPDAVSALLQRGAKVNQKSRDDGWSPLHVASMRGLVIIVELLLDWGADVNAKDKRQVTSLHFCAGVKSRESEEICRRLMAKHARVSPRDINGTTPLHIACAAGNSAVLLMILDKMAKFMPDALDLVDGKGCTPFHYAAMGGHSDCIDILKRELPICEQWADDLGLSYSSWALTRGHFLSDFYPAGLQPFCADFASCVNEERTSDVVFLVEGIPVYAHKILCYTSPYLAKLIDVIAPLSPDLLAANPQFPHVGHKPLIDIKGIVSHKLFVEILQFMYTSKVPKDPDWTQLWFAAVRLDLLRLQQLCEKELGGNPLRERSLSIASKRSSSSNPTTPTTPPTTPPITSLQNSDTIPQLSLSTTLPITPTAPSTVHDISTISSSPPLTTAISSDPTISTSDSPSSTTDTTLKTSDSVSNRLSVDTSTIGTASHDTINTIITDPSSASNHTQPAQLRRRTTSRKRSNSSVSRMQMGVDPQMDYVHGLSGALRKFVGNPMFHDMLLVCAEEAVYAHTVIVKKRSPNFFLVLGKNILPEHANTTTTEYVFHFDDITKGAMMSLMEYIYGGGFHSKIEPEDAWVMYNFVVKHSLICPGLKERAGYLFYNSLSPDNLLDLVALNRYGFTINTLPYNPAESARYAASYNKEGSPPRLPPSPRSKTSPPTSPFASIATPNNTSNSLSSSPFSSPSSFNGTSPDANRNSISLPNSLNRNSVNLSGSPNRNSISINRLPSPTTVHSANQEILLSILKYASKPFILKYIIKHNKKNPTIKFLQTELRKYKPEQPETDTSKLWKERRKEVKIFAKNKKIQAESQSNGRRN